jgi:hypothetical protein
MRSKNSVRCGWCASLYVLFAIAATTANARPPEVDWCQSFIDGSNSSGSQRPRGIALASGGGVYVIGSFSGTVDFDPGSGVSEVTSSGSSFFLCRFVQDGTLQWVKTLVGASGSVTPNGLRIASDGTLVMEGNFRSATDFDPGEGESNLTPVDSEDKFILKLNADGDFESVQQLNLPATEFTLDSNDNIYLCGHFTGTVDFDPGTGTAELTAEEDDSFVLKLDASGSFVWVRQFECTRASQIRDVESDSNGNICVIGSFGGSIDLDPGAAEHSVSSIVPPDEFINTTDTFVVKLDSDGDFVWAKHYFGELAIAEGFELEIGTDDSIHVSGDYGGELSIGSAALPVPVYGGTFVAKLNSDGSVVWARGFDAWTYSMNVDSPGSLYLAGELDPIAFEVDLDPGVGELIVRAQVTSKAIMLKLNSNGQFIWGGSFGEGAESEARQILGDDNGGVYLASTLEGNVDVAPGPEFFIPEIGDNAAIVVERLLEQFSLRDVNRDGLVAAVDVQIVINASLNLPVSADADVNDDGAIDAVDVQLTINEALGL